MIRHALAFALAALAAAPSPDPARAQDRLEPVDAFVQRRATGQLALLGMTLVPNETASTLFLNSSSGDGFDYQNNQLGAGFTVSRETPLYLEGFLGWARYAPSVLVDDGEDIVPLEVKWTSVGATGGIGWDFFITDELAFRPILNVSLGHLESDLSLLGRYLNHKLDADIDFLKNGRLTAAGIGAAVMLDLERVRENYELDMELRYTHMHLQPIAGSKHIDASSAAATLGSWNRLRVPTGFTVLRRPLRAVFEASGSLYPGDQGKTLRTDWLLQGGIGLEVDLTDTSLPLTKRARIVARYAFGEHLTGFSLGFAVTF